MKTTTKRAGTAITVNLRMPGCMANISCVYLKAAGNRSPSVSNCRDWRCPRSKLKIMALLNEPERLPCPKWVQLPA